MNIHSALSAIERRRIEEAQQTAGYVEFAATTALDDLFADHGDEAAKAFIDTYLLRRRVAKIVRKSA